MSAADSVSGDHCDYRFGAGAHLTLKIEHIQSMHPGFVFVPGVASNLLIAA